MSTLLQTLWTLLDLLGFAFVRDVFFALPPHSKLDRALRQIYIYIYGPILIANAKTEAVGEPSPGLGSTGRWGVDTVSGLDKSEFHFI